MSRRAVNRSTVTRNKRIVTTIVVQREVVTCGPVAEAVGAVVRELRLGMGMTQQELADQVGLNRTSITNIEIGRQRIVLDDVWALAKALRVTPMGLFNMIESKVP